MLYQEQENSNLAKPNQPSLGRVLDLLHYRGTRPRRYYMCHCPAHDDRKPSLSVSSGDDGRILLHCFAGCPTNAILYALGLTLRDIMPAKQRRRLDARQAAMRAAGRPKRSPAATPKENPSENAKASLIEPRKARKHRLGNIVAEYDYRDAGGYLVCQVVRFEPKNFRQRTRFGDEWIWGLNGVRPPLYRLPELLASSPEEWVFVVEGEKDVEA